MSPVTAGAKAVIEVRNFVDGSFCEGAGTFDKVSPVDGSLVATVHEADRVVVDAAVAAARGALDGAWGATSVAERAALLRRVAAVIGAVQMKENS